MADETRERVERAVAEMSAQAARRIAEGDPADIAIASEDALDEDEVEKLRHLVHRLCQARVAA